MHRRTINNILRNYPSCKNLDKSISLSTYENDLTTSFFNKEAVAIMAICSSNYMTCMMHDSFPYFYDYGANNTASTKASFFFNVHKMQHLLVYDPYNSLSECKRVLGKFIKHDKYLNIVNDMLNHLQFQDSACFRYRFDVQTEVNSIEYMIGSGSFSFFIKLKFTDQSIIVDFNSTIDWNRSESNFFGEFDSFKAICDRGFRLNGLDFIMFENLCEFDTDFVSMAKIQKIYNY